MKYLSKRELEALINRLRGDVSSIRKANDELKRNLAVLEEPQSRVYNESERLVLRSEMKKDALAKVATAHQGFDTTRQLIERNSEFWKDKFFAVVNLRSPTSVSDEANERAWLLQKYSVMSASRFSESLRDAAEDGRPAELGVARLAFEQRDWSEEERDKVSLALFEAEKNVNYPDRNESLEMLDIASGLLEDAQSSHDALRTGEEDVRLKMAPYVQQRLDKQHQES